MKKSPVIPQADDSDTSAEIPRTKGILRQYFSKKLSGDGLELGGLNNPMPVHEGMNVKYVDHLPVEDLEKLYPEFSDTKIIKPDILDDAQNLNLISDESQDFVIASHLIEHISDPIKAIENWLRVLMPGGKLYIVTPDKRQIFDKYRPRTRLAHLVGDYQNWYTSEKVKDWHHYLEYVDLVDNLYFGNERSPDEIIKYAKEIQNSNYRIHLHCFLPVDMEEILKWVHENIYPFQSLEGPVQYKGECEFHVLIQK